MRNLRKLPFLALIAFAAACGGDKGGETGGAATTDPAAGEGAAAPAATGQVHEVKMVTTQNGASGVVEPATLTVKKGDVIRFVNDGGAAHNASFPPAINPGKSNLPPAGPYLTSAGQTYELNTGTMDAGEYNYQCDPHATMGMVGKVTIQ